MVQGHTGERTGSGATVPPPTAAAIPAYLHLGVHGSRREGAAAGDLLQALLHGCLDLPHNRATASSVQPTGMSTTFAHAILISLIAVSVDYDTTVESTGIFSCNLGLGRHSGQAHHDLFPFVPSSLCLRSCMSGS